MRKLLVVTGILLAGSSQAHAMDITPLAVGNQSPLASIFGLPTYTDPAILANGHYSVGLTEDVASDFAVNNAAGEAVVLDGETYRTTLALHYGLFDRYEIGAELPVVYQSGGFLDNVIEGWHSTFGLPQGGRNAAPKNRLLFSYVRGGVQQALLTHDDIGLGDAAVDGGVKLFDQQDGSLHERLALRGSVALPTGSASHLTGDGSETASTFVTGGLNATTSVGTLGVFGAVGDAALGQGQVIKGLQNTNAMFAQVGAGWSPVDWASLTVQLNWNQPFFKASALPELGKNATYLTTNLGFTLPQDWKLDLGFTEDVAVATAPDIAFNLGLSKKF